MGHTTPLYTVLTRSSPDSGSWDWSASCHIEGLYTAVLLLQTVVNHLQSIGMTHHLKDLAQFGNSTTLGKREGGGKEGGREGGREREREGHRQL